MFSLCENNLHAYYIWAIAENALPRFTTWVSSSSNPTRENRWTKCSEQAVHRSNCFKKITAMLVSSQAIYTDLTWGYYNSNLLRPNIKVNLEVVTIIRICSSKGEGRKQNQQRQEQRKAVELRSLHCSKSGWSKPNINGTRRCLGICKQAAIKEASRKRQDP